MCSFACTTPTGRTRASNQTLQPSSAIPCISLAVRARQHDCLLCMHCGSLLDHQTRHSTCVRGVLPIIGAEPQVRTLGHGVHGGGRPLGFERGLIPPLTVGGRPPGGGLVGGGGGPGGPIGGEGPGGATWGGGGLGQGYMPCPQGQSVGQPQAALLGCGPPPWDPWDPRSRSPRDGVFGFRRVRRPTGRVPANLPWVQEPCALTSRPAEVFRGKESPAAGGLMCPLRNRRRPGRHIKVTSAGESACNTAQREIPHQAWAHCNEPCLRSLTCLSSRCPPPAALPPQRTSLEWQFVQTS